MSKNIGVIVVGVGFVGGQAHTPSFKKIEGSNLVALCARTERRVKPLAEKWGVKYYLDYDEALMNPELDAVVIAVPTPYHYEYTMKAIKKGKHVLLEMPITPKIEQIKEIKKAAKEAGVTVMPILNFRFAPIYVKIKEMIKEGKIGKPIAVHYREFLPASALAEQWPSGSWAWDIEKSGGYPDYTLSVWGIDMLRWLLDSEFKDIQWKASYPKLEQFGGILGYNTMGVAKFENGAVCTLHFGASVNALASETRLEVYGDNTDVIHGIWNNKIKLIGRGDKVEEIDVPVKGTRVWGHRQIDTHFIECILDNKEPSVTLDDAIVAQKHADGITENLKK
jgi:predicted dehydrogenase